MEGSPDCGTLEGEDGLESPGRVGWWLVTMMMDENGQF